MKKLLTICIFTLFSLQVFPQTSDTVTSILNFNWIPNSNSVCFSAVRRSSNWQNIYGIAIFKMDISSGQTNLLLESASNPVVSPDGKKMAFTKLEDGTFKGNYNLFLYDFETGTQRAIIEDSLRENEPTWSPDGNQIAFTLLTGEKGKPQSIDIWTIDLATGKKKQITQTQKGYKNYNPVWAPEGKSIVYYLEKGDSHDQIYLTDSDGSFHTNLTSDSTTHNYYPSWRGKQIIYTQNPGKTMIISQDGTQKSLFMDMEAFWVRYNPGIDKYAYLTAGTMIKPSEFRILDYNTKETRELISAQELSKLPFTKQ